MLKKRLFAFVLVAWIGLAPYNPSCFLLWHLQALLLPLRLGFPTKSVLLPSLPCCAPHKGLDGLSALSKKGAAMTADSPTTTLDALIDCNTTLHTIDAAGLGRILATLTGGDSM